MKVARRFVALAVLVAFRLPGVTVEIPESNSATPAKEIARPLAPAGSSASAEGARASVKPDAAAIAPEIIVDPKDVAFESAAAVTCSLIVRNVGDTKLQAAPEWFWGLVLVWDGKDYERDAQYKAAWNGPAEILPRSVWRSAFSLSEYQVPPEVLTEGRHSLAVRDGRSKSNVVTISIGKTK